MISLLIGTALAIAALAIFSAYEAAVTELSRIRLRHWAGKQLAGSPTAELLERPQRLVTMAFAGANLAKVALAVQLAQLLVRATDLPTTAPALAAVAVALAGTVPAVLLGEVVPRTVVREAPGRVLPPLFAAGPLLVWLVWPFTVLMRASTRAFCALLDISAPDESRSLTREAVETLLREGEREGLVEPHERQIINEIFHFGETPVRDVMTPREEMVAVRLGAPRAELARRIWETGLSRFPVIDGSPENIVGIVHAVDVLKARDGQRLRLRPTLYVPGSTTCAELLYAMRRQRIQLAVVMDAQGSPAGIVTMEDLVEELVGEIRDEHDVEEDAGPVEPDRQVSGEGRKEGARD